MQLPGTYQWLSREEAPRHLLKALELYGTEESVGPKNNPIILEWAKELKLSWYTDDSIPWCGLFLSIIMYRAGRPLAKEPLRALSWSSWGVPVSTAMLGDVLTFTRSGGGHVGIYVGEDDVAYHVVGGNQGDKVCVTRIAKNRLHAARRPAYTNPPANIRRVFLSSNGTLSQNEA